jgi:hypothetical protein
MSIDMASVYAERFKSNPDMLRAAVMGQSPDPKLDPYTALNALRLVKESQQMAMAGQAQQPTSAPSILAQNLAPPAPPQGLAGMVPMGAPAGQMPQRAPMPQPVMQAASGGLASMPTTDEDYCGGGIVAFSRGGEAEDDYQQETSDTGYSDSQGRSVDAEGNLIDDDTDAGTGNATDRFNTLLAKQIAKIQGGSSRVTSPEDAARMEEEYYQRELKRAGPDIYAAEIARAPQDEADRLRARRVGEANALFTAAGKVLTGNRLSTGAREALPAYGNEMNAVERADQAAKSANARAQFALKDAQRKERMGSSRAAQASMENYRKFQQDENRATMDRDRIVAELAAKGIVGNRPTGKGAGASAPKLAEQLAAAEIEYGRNPTKENKIAVDALTRAAAKTRTSFSTGESGPGRLGAQQEALTSKENIEANKALDKHKLMQGREWRKSVEAAGSVEAAEKQFKSKWITNNPQSAEAAPTKSSAAPAPKPTATSKVISMADVDATVAASGKSRQEVMDALNAKGYTVK